MTDVHQTRRGLINAEAIFMKNITIGGIIFMGTFIISIGYVILSSKNVKQETVLNKAYQPDVLSAQLIPDANNDGHPELNVYLQDGTTKTIYSDNVGKFLMPSVFGSKLETNLKPEATQGLEGK